MALNRYVLTSDVTVAAGTAATVVASEPGTGGAAGRGNAAATGGPLWATAYLRNTVIVLDPAGPVYAPDRGGQPPGVHPGPGRHQPLRRGEQLMARTSEPTVRIYVVNGLRTSAGNGPGVFELPAEEASSIITRKYGRPLGPGEDPADIGRTRRFSEGVSN